MSNYTQSKNCAMKSKNCILEELQLQSKILSPKKLRDEQENETVISQKEVSQNKSEGDSKSVPHMEKF